MSSLFAAEAIPSDPRLLNSTNALLVRRKSGEMVLYPFRDGTFFSGGGPIRVGHGFRFTHYMIGNWDSKTRRADLIVRTANGELLLYPFRDNAFYSAGGPIKVGHGFHFEDYFVANWDPSDPAPDLIVRRASGELLLYPFKNGTFYSGGGPIKVGHGFNFTHYFVGHWRGSGPSLIVRTNSGDLLLYPFRNRTFYSAGGPIKVGHGFHFEDYFVANWDPSDPAPDLIVRRASGELLLYPFKNGTFYSGGGPIKVGHGFNFTHYFVGHWRGDRPSLIVQSKSGDLFLYPFKNRTFYSGGGPIKVGSGWKFTDYLAANWFDPPKGKGKGELAKIGDALARPVVEVYKALRRYVWYYGCPPEDEDKEECKQKAPSEAPDQSEPKAGIKHLFADCVCEHDNGEINAHFYDTGGTCFDTVQVGDVVAVSATGCYYLGACRDHARTETVTIKVMEKHCRTDLIYKGMIDGFPVNP